VYIFSFIGLFARHGQGVLSAGSAFKKGQKIRVAGKWNGRQSVEVQGCQVGEQK